MEINRNYENNWGRYAFKNNTGSNGNDHRDDDMYFARTSMGVRNSEDLSEDVDIISRHNYISSTESSESYNSIKRLSYSISTQSSGSYISSSRDSLSISGESSLTNSIGVQEKTRWRQRIDSSVISSVGRSNNSIEMQGIKRGRQLIERDFRVQGPRTSIPPMSSTKLILDDLTEMKAKIDLTDMQTEIEEILAQGRTATSRGESRNSNCYPQRALWKLLMERRWEWARERIRSHPGEVRTKIRLPAVAEHVTDEEYFKNIEGSDYVHSALPLHLACADRPLPPTALLRDLIAAYPGACRQCQESSGLLPIHMAADLRSVVRFHKNSLRLSEEGEKQRSGKFPTSKEDKQIELRNKNMQQIEVDSQNHEYIIKLLLSSYPESISVRETVNGMTPLHIAASTTRAENGIVSPVASKVLNILMINSSANAVNFCKDKNGLTPYDWAWRNVEYFCPRCRKAFMSNGTLETMLLPVNKQIDSMGDRNAGTRCKCNQSLSVSEKCLHPFLREEIRNHLSASTKPPTTRREADGVILSTRKGKPKKTVLSPEKTKESQRPSRKSPQDILQNRRAKETETLSRILKKDAGRNSMTSGIRGPTNNGNARQRIPKKDAWRNITTSGIRGPTNNGNARQRETLSTKNACKNDALESDKTASLHMKIRLSEIVHPSLHGKRRRNGINKKGSNLPSPYFELFAAHRRGISTSFYKSYPLLESSEGTWEDAFLDLGFTHKQLQYGTNGAEYIEIGIRVMHCPEKGSEIKLIGTSQLSLETLQKQQNDRLHLQKEISRLKGFLGDGQEVAMSLPEPEKHPILKGFEVTGKLQVIYLAIK